MKKVLIVLMFSAISIFANGGELEQMQRIQQVFNELRADNLEILDEFYADDAEFIDPLGTHNGLAAIKEYYKNLYQTVSFIEFKFGDKSFTSGDRHFLEWTMELKAEGLKGGELVTLEGSSVIVFNEDNKVSYHRDYFDMGEFIYEHIPGLGWLIRKIKKRLKN